MLFNVRRLTLERNLPNWLEKVYSLLISIYYSEYAGSDCNTSAFYTEDALFRSILTGVYRRFTQFLQTNAEIVGLP
jgi:hypothetical protein